MLSACWTSKIEVYERKSDFINYLKQYFKIAPDKLKGESIFIIIQSQQCVTCTIDQLNLIDSICQKEKPILIMENNKQIINIFDFASHNILIDTTRAIHKFGLIGSYHEVIELEDTSVVFYRKFKNTTVAEIRNHFLH